jgi:hypothetical protein
VLHAPERERRIGRDSAVYEHASHFQSRCQLPRPVEIAGPNAGLRAVLIPATVEIREDTAAQLSIFRAIREKYGMNVLSDEEHLESLIAEGRVLLVITPDGPPPTWTAWGFD